MSASRITYEVKKGEVKITRTKRVNTRLPPSTPSKILDSGVGSWVEVRDARGSRIWGRTLDENFLNNLASTQIGDGLGTMTRVAIKKMKEQILVPFVDSGTVYFMHRAQCGKKPDVLTEFQL